MTGPPAPRYRVVERGRRLEVIDLQSSSPAAPRLSAPRNGLSGEGWTFATQAWFDNKGPRRIAIGAGRTRLLWAIIAVLVVLLAAVLASLWWLGFAAVMPIGLLLGWLNQQARPLATRMFDRFAQPDRSGR